jgi:hypothetical protein
MLLVALNVNFYNAGVVTQGRRIGSGDQCFDLQNILSQKLGEQLPFFTQNTLKNNANFMLKIGKNRRNF